MKRTLVEVVLVDGGIARHVLRCLLLVMTLLPAKHLPEEVELGVRDADHGEQNNRERYEPHLEADGFKGSGVATEFQGELLFAKGNGGQSLTDLGMHCCPDLGGPGSYRQPLFALSGH